MKLRYSNKELSNMLKESGMSLSSKTIYYYSITELPEHMIQKQYFPDRYHHPLKVGDILFNSERQCISVFLACLLDDNLENFVSTEYLFNLNSKSLIRSVYECKTPCGSSLFFKTNRPMDHLERMLVSKWMLFLNIIACRYKFSTLNSRRAYEELMKTGNKFLCYAHPNDKEYGIYMTPENAATKMTDPLQWLGNNIHGRILMTVRDEIKSIPLKTIPKDPENVINIIVRCARPGLLKIHLGMCEYLLGMEKDTISLNQVNQDNISFIYEVSVHMQKTKTINNTINKLKELLLDYPELEII